LKPFGAGLVLSRVRESACFAGVLGIDCPAVENNSLIRWTIN
jgi:hypothetical protein